MKKPIRNLIKFVNFSLKVDANSTSTSAAYQPKAPEKLNSLKKTNDK